MFLILLLLLLQWQHTQVYIFVGVTHLRTSSFVIIIINSHTLTYTYTYVNTCLHLKFELFGVSFHRVAYPAARCFAPLPQHIVYFIVHYTCACVCVYGRVLLSPPCHKIHCLRAHFQLFFFYSN